MYFINILVRYLEATSTPTLQFIIPCTPQSKPAICDFIPDLGTIIFPWGLKFMAVRKVIYRGRIFWLTVFQFWGEVSPRASILLMFAGHPTTVFCKISVLRSKYCLQFSISWEQLKNSKWPFRSCTIFEAYLINSLRFSEFNFSHSLLDPG